MAGTLIMKGPEGPCQDANIPQEWDSLDRMDVV